MKIKRPITIKGVEYRYLKDALKAYNISAPSYRRRLERGFSMEDAITSRHITSGMREFIGNEKPISIGNMKFKSTKEFCEFCGINHRTYYSRLKKGWSLKKIANTPPRSQQKPIKIKGIEYSSLTDALNAYKISRQTVHIRMKKNGMSLKEAITTPLKRSRKGTNNDSK